MHSRMQKITNNNGWLIAGSGDSIVCDILQHVFIPPVPTIKERDDLYHFMITKFVPDMRDCLDENGIKFGAGEKEYTFNTLFAFDGEIFDIGDDFSVLLNDDGIYGVGNGSQFAIGALEAGASIEEALTIAAKNDIYTSGPFQIVTQEKQIKKIK